MNWIAGLAIAFVVIVVIGMFWLNAENRRSCELAGGHYVTQYHGDRECWSLDGTRRLFPDGF